MFIKNRNNKKVKDKTDWKRYLKINGMIEYFRIGFIHA